MDSAIVKLQTAKVATTPHQIQITAIINSIIIMRNLVVVREETVQTKES